MFLAIVLITLLIVAVKRSDDGFGSLFESEKRRAGRRGENIARNAIDQVLCDNDHTFSGIEIIYDGHRAEMDNIIVNQYGVFIIEVKNYTGILVGSIDDRKWRKYKMTDAGNVYEKEAENPVVQAQWHAGLLGKYLRKCGIENAWVEGYAYLVRNNSPVDSGRILRDKHDIDRAVHTSKGKRLTIDEINQIAKILRN